MDDPTRLLSAHGGASGLERELLESMPNMGPPEGAKARAWEALAVQLATAVVGAGVGAGVSTAKAAGAAATKASLTTKVLGTKVIAIMVVGGLTVGGGIWAVSPAQETAAPVSPKAAARDNANAPPTPARDPAEESAKDPVDPEQASAVETAAPSTPRKMSALKPQDSLNRESALKRQDSLIRESALLKQARAQLQAGDAKAAQASLDRLAAEFPAGMLGQEREVLAISVLSAEGQLKRAQQRARAFVKAHPQSPHSATLHELLEPR